MTTGTTATVVDLATASVRELNQLLHDRESGAFRVVNPAGAHCLAAGLRHELDVVIEGHAGYYCAGMNQLATVHVDGNAGTGLAENIMSGRVSVSGDASASVAASGRGGLVVVEGDAAARCGISMKGVDIVVGGSIGHMGGFMAQRGWLVVCGDAGPALGDSIYEASIFVRGEAPELGADCIEKPVREEHLLRLRELLDDAGFAGIDEREFRRYGSARRLYHFHSDHASAY